MKKKNNMEETKTKEQECVEELNAVLLKHNMMLVPSFKLMPVPAPEVKEEKDEKGRDK